MIKNKKKTVITLIVKIQNSCMYIYKCYKMSITISKYNVCKNVRMPHDRWKFIKCMNVCKTCVCKHLNNKRIYVIIPINLWYLVICIYIKHLYRFLWILSFYFLRFNFFYFILYVSISFLFRYIKFQANILVCQNISFCYFTDLLYILYLLLCVYFWDIWKK